MYILVVGDSDGNLTATIHEDTFSVAEAAETLPPDIEPVRSWLPDGMRNRAMVVDATPVNFSEAKLFRFQIG